MTCHWHLTHICACIDSWDPGGAKSACRAINAFIHSCYTCGRSSYKPRLPISNACPHTNLLERLNPNTDSQSRWEYIEDVVRRGQRNCRPERPAQQSFARQHIAETAESSMCKGRSECVGSSISHRQSVIGCCTEYRPFGEPTEGSMGNATQNQHIMTNRTNSCAVSRSHTAAVQCCVGRSGSGAT
jgi:hypothetical protein